MASQRLNRRIIQRALNTTFYDFPSLAKEGHIFVYYFYVCAQNI